jgi:hypothetical protein
MLKQTILKPPSAIQIMTERLFHLNPPEALRSRGQDHIACLTKLSDSLSKLGWDEAAVGQHLFGLFERYEEQLRHAVSAHQASNLEVLR